MKNIWSDLSGWVTLIVALITGTVFFVRLDSKVSSIEKELQLFKEKQLTISKNIDNASELNNKTKLLLNKLNVNISNYKRTNIKSRIPVTYKGKEFSITLNGCTKSSDEIICLFNIVNNTNSYNSFMINKLSKLITDKNEICYISRVQLDDKTVSFSKETYLDSINKGFDPNEEALLQAVFFVRNKKIKYASIVELRTDENNMDYPVHFFNVSVKQ